MMLISTCILAAIVGSADVPVKHIGAPAEDLHSGWLREADPREHGARAHHGVFESTFINSSVTIELTVPGGRPLRLLPVGHDATSWTIKATGPDGITHVGDTADSILHQGNLLPFGGQAGQRLDILEPRGGLWSVRITGGIDGDRMAMYVEDGAQLHLRAWLDEYAAHVGDEISINIGCSDRQDVELNGDLAMNNAVVRGESILSAQAYLRHDDGSKVPLTLRGDRCSFHATEAGISTVIIDAILADGHGGVLHRTVTMPIAIEDDLPLMSGDVAVHIRDEHRVGIDLKLATRSSRERVLAGAEVWARGPDGLRPRCWIGGMTPLDDDVMRLVLDTRWLHGCDGTTVELRSVRMADVDTFVPLNRLDSAHLPFIDLPTAAPMANDRAAMQMGALHGGRTIRADVAAPSRPAQRTAQYGGHNLMLAHGYCEDGDAWELNDFNGDFTEYLNLEQNFTHDEFALDIWSFGSQYKSYSVIGHSQGGNAGLHLYSFYWSGIDWSTGARKVQALGTPFLGTPLAGSIADLGEVFGIQCGSNYDMTYDGAAQWASYIPGWARASTWVWSTTFEDGWFYDYCNLFSDVLLWDPEDGVVEVSGAHLDGTNDMGTKEGWCHIEDMSDPAQTYDPTRNAEMNAEGAR
jgi:hypothetical protein